ncbi:hypothetical protein P5673_011501 [Acropora cervicornis]|uniref:Uncharacterized protein n=1 Tax=Acropora cervicornis TaxID=6130 RepID=A0AAD9V855_ACRCE|nr:hypothetical protein P5673_011501 [Acropora cervicornis]
MAREDKENSCSEQPGIVVNLRPWYFVFNLSHNQARCLFYLICSINVKSRFPKQLPGEAMRMSKSYREGLVPTVSWLQSDFLNSPGLPLDSLLPLMVL